MKIRRWPSFLTLCVFLFSTGKGDAFTSPTKPLVVIKQVTSKKGIKAWLVEDHSIPVVSMSASFDGGSLLDPQGLEGIALIMAQMMMEGAGPYTHKTYFDYKADHAIDINFSSSQDYMDFSLRTTRDMLEKSFELLKITLYKTRFDEKSLKKVKDAYLVQLDNLEKEPSYIAQTAIAQILFKGHPYARLVNGTKSSIGKIKSADLFKLRDRQFKKNRLIIGVCGDISEMELSQKLDDLFGDLPVDPALDKIDRIGLPQVGSEHIIHNKRPQSTVLFAQPSIRSNDPNYIKVMILDKILGDGFTSRLMKTLRVNGGLVYSIGTGASSRRLADLLSGTFAADNQNVHKAIDLVRTEFTKLRDQGITAAELEAAKASLIGGYPLRFNSSLGIANIAHGYQRLGLPIDYVDDRTRRINEVTLEEVNAFAKTFLQPDALTFVIVGDPKKEDALKTPSLPSKDANP